MSQDAEGIGERGFAGLAERLIKDGSAFLAAISFVGSAGELSLADGALPVILTISFVHHTFSGLSGFASAKLLRTIPSPLKFGPRKT